MFEKISIDPAICHGETCIKGTRIPVHQIVYMLANGDSIEGLLEDFPSLTRDDILYSSVLGLSGFQISDIE